MLRNSVLLGYGDCYNPYMGQTYIFCPIQIPYLLPTPGNPGPELLTKQSDSEQSPEMSAGTSIRHTRKTWTKQEDAKILKIIRDMHLSEEQRIPYRLIAHQFKDRTSKQIRQRYLNKLDSRIVRSDFSEVDDRTILQFYQTNGPKWKRLSNLLKGRTATSLKNRFNTKLKKRLVSNRNGFANASDQQQPEAELKLKPAELKPAV